MRAWLLVAAVAIAASSCAPIARSAVAPDGGPSVLIQQFGGMNDQPPLRVQRSVRIFDSGEMGQLADELNALPPFPNGVWSCPFDDAAYFEVLFTYADGTSTPFRVNARGCRAVYVGKTNPRVLWAARSPELFDTLTRLLSHQ
jgi:hypothetical protein